MFRRWEVYNDAYQGTVDEHVSYHWTRFAAVQKVQSLDSMRAALGFDRKHHRYRVRRVEK